MMAPKSFHQPAHSMQSSFGETGQQFFKSTYFDKSKIGNNIIDFDIECINKALQAEGKVGISSEKIATRVWEHYVDSARVVKRCFGNKVKDDWNLYNWGLALTQEFGLEQDRIELLVLIYGKTVPNRLNLAEFELLVLKHTSYKAMEKQERKYKWLDLMASFRIQSIKLRPSDECWTIGKRQLRTVLEVNDLNIVFDVTAFTSDLKRCDRYTNKVHMLLLDDPLISGKRLSLASGRGSTTSLEAMAHAEKRRLEQFKKKIAAEEDQQELEGDRDNGDNGEMTDDPDNKPPVIDKKKAAEDSMRNAFRKKEREKEQRAAERAVKMAQKAEARASYLKEDEDRRQRVAAYIAKMREEKQRINALGAEVTEEERREVDDFDGDGDGDGEDTSRKQQGSLTATLMSEEHRLSIVEEEKEQEPQPQLLPPISTVPLTVEEMLRAELNAKLTAHQQRKANEKEAEKRRLREMVKTRLDARKARMAEEAAVKEAARRVAAEEEEKRRKIIEEREERARWEEEARQKREQELLTQKSTRVDRLKKVSSSSRHNMSSSNKGNEWG